VDAAFDALYDEVLKAAVSTYCGEAIDEERLLAGALDSLDTARALDESSIALEDAGGALASTGREPPTLGALEFRRGLAQQLKSGAATNSEAAEMLRCLAEDLSRVVERQRTAGEKARRDEELRAFGRRLQAEMKAEAETPEALAARFEREYSNTMQWEPSIADRIAQRADLSRREAIERGETLSE
jgi:hypothetical protein